MFVVKSLVFCCMIFNVFAFKYKTKLPDYITPCKKGDGFINCAVESANKALPFIVKGDPDYNVPNLMPLKVPVVNVISTPTLSLNLTDLEIHNMDSLKVTYASVDFEKRHFIVKVFGHNITLICNYHINGQVLVLPIKGDGRGLFRFDDTTFVYDSEFVTPVIKGAEHFRLKSDSLNLEPSNVFFKLDNLFGGDKLIGDNVNNFLNENWRDLIGEFGKTVGISINVLIRRIVEGITYGVPFSELLPQ